MNFKKGITYKEFIKFLFPSILVMLSISIYTVVDGYFVSKYVGSNALAAINIILPINSVMFAVGLMFSAGGGALASIKLGENDAKTASKYFSNLLTIAIGFGIATMILALVFQDNLLNFLGANESLLPYAKKYSLYIILTLPLLMIKIIFAGFLRAEGSPKASLIMSLIGGFVNMILDFIFIVKLDMGISGAGLATLIGILSAIIYGARYFASKKAVFRFGFHPIDFKFVKNTIFNGSSEMVNELAVGFTIMIFNLLTIKHAGNDGVAAISVILYINFLISSVYIGFSIGVAPLLSYQYGAKNLVALKQIMGYARKTLLIISPLL